MGVKGLWTILDPAGEPINQASLKDHRLAVDASIWMYQLTKALPASSSTNGYNPQILAGLFKRILKLLYFGIKPVFVFDGGVPELKALTVKERRGKRAEAESRYKSLAKKMLKIRLKMAALGNKGKPQDLPAKTEEILEDQEDELIESSEEELFDVDYEQLDRLDITSPDFQSLPLDLKQELLAAMKERALEEKARNPSTFSNDALTFSQGQIEALVKRRKIAAELEKVSKSSFGAFGKPSEINGQNHRIASSSTREFVLVKNESGGGWAFDQKIHDLVVPEKSSPAEMKPATSDEDKDFEKMFFEDDEIVEKPLPDVFDKPISIESRPTLLETMVETEQFHATLSESESEAELLEASEIIMQSGPVVIQPDAAIIQTVSGDKQSVRASREPVRREIPETAKSVEIEHRAIESPPPVSHLVLSEEDEDLGDFLDSFKNTTKEELEDRLRQSLIEAQSDIKAAQNESRGLENELLADFKQLLSLFGIPWMTAEMEAEAQCAWLHAEGLVDGVITDDSDVWLFAGSESLLVYRNFFKEGRPVMAFGGHRIAIQLSLRREDLICLAMWLGGDYGVGVRGLGTTRALSLLQILKRSQTYSQLIACAMDYCVTVLNLFKAAHEDLDAIRAEWTLEDQQALGKLLRQVHHLEADFPSKRIIEAYLEPVISNDNRPFKWQIPNIIGLEAFLLSRLDWPVERTKSHLLPVLKSKNL